MTTLTVTLSEEDWGKTLNFLAEQPFKQVAPIIQQMQRQLQLQMEQSQRDQNVSVVNKTNGTSETAAPGA